MRQSLWVIRTNSANVGEFLATITAHKELFDAHQQLMRTDPLYKQHTDSPATQSMPSSQPVNIFPPQSQPQHQPIDLSKQSERVWLQKQSAEKNKVSVSQPDQSNRSSLKPCLHASECTDNGLKCQHRLHPSKSARHHLSWNKHALHPRCDSTTCPVFDVNGEALLCMVRVCQAVQHAVSKGHNSTPFDVLQQITYTDRAEAIQYILSAASAVETYFAQKYRDNKQAGTVKKEMSAQMNEFLTTLGLSVFVHANRDMGYYAVQTIRFWKNGVKRRPARQTSSSLSTTTTTVDPTLTVDITIQSTDSTSNFVDVTSPSASTISVTASSNGIWAEMNELSLSATTFNNSCETDEFDNTSHATDHSSLASNDTTNASVSKKVQQTETEIKGATVESVSDVKQRSTMDVRPLLLSTG